MVEERLMRDSYKIDLTNGGITDLHIHLPRIIILKKASDQISTLISLTDVSDLGFAVQPNTDYGFMFILVFQTTKTTTGIRVDFNGPTNPVFVAWRRETAKATEVAGTDNVLVRDLVAYQSDSPSGTTGLVNSNHLIIIKGVLRNGPNSGMLQLQFASEVSGSPVTIKGGSWGIIS